MSVPVKRASLLMAAISLSPFCALHPQSAGDSAAAVAIAVTPASTFVTMNPAIFGDSVRSALGFNLAHKPAWRTYGGTINVGALRLSLGRSEFAEVPRDRHFFVGADYARRVLEFKPVQHVGFVLGADASVGYGAEDFGPGTGTVGKTAGITLASGLRFFGKAGELTPYFAPAGFWGRYTRVYGRETFSHSGWRITQGGGLRLQLADGPGFEMAVRKTRIGDAVPRYGFGVWYRSAPLPNPALSEVRNLKVEMDNDFYAFWQPPDKRPDEDYTNGLRVSFNRVHPFGLLRFLARAPACGEQAASESCTATRIEFGQEIYTPRFDSTQYLQHDRPYAGWLYATYESPRVTRENESTISLTAGVVGPESMAERVQKAFHALFPWYHRPNGWNEQLRFEPGVVFGYSRRYLVLSDRLPPASVQLIPEWSVAAGNIRTAASGAVGVRAGYRVSHPWLYSAAPFGDWSVYFFSKAREDLVLRNIFLDGNTFNGKSHVRRIPFVGQLEGGVGVRFGMATAEYRGVTRQREYRSDAPRTVSIPATHPYGTLSLALAKAF